MCGMNIGEMYNGEYAKFADIPLVTLAPLWSERACNTVNQVEHHVVYTTELQREQFYYKVYEGGIHEVNSAASCNEWNLGRLIAASSSDKQYGSTSSTNSRQILL
jgi:hypothetical protein